MSNHEDFLKKNTTNKKISNVVDELENELELIRKYKEELIEKFIKENKENLDNDQGTIYYYLKSGTEDNNLFNKYLEKTEREIKLIPDDKIKMEMFYIHKKLLYSAGHSIFLSPNSGNVVDYKKKEQRRNHNQFLNNNSTSNSGFDDVSEKNGSFIDKIKFIFNGTVSSDLTKSQIDREIEKRESAKRHQEFLDNNSTSNSELE